MRRAVLGELLQWAGRKWLEWGVLVLAELIQRGGGGVEGSGLNAECWSSGADTEGWWVGWREVV